MILSHDIILYYIPSTVSISNPAIIKFLLIQIIPSLVTWVNRVSRHFRVVRPVILCAFCFTRKMRYG